MSDNKQQTGKQDDIRVDGNDASEVQYIHSKFPGATLEEVREAIRTQGPLRKDIEQYLKGK